MPRDQFAEFVADIQERGVLVPIEVHGGGTILDGRTRWMAAKKLGLRHVRVVPAPVNDTHPVIYMLRAASKRRHLSDDQRACLAQEEMELLSAINRRERAQAAGTAGGKGRPKPSQDGDSIATGVIGKLSPRDRRRESRSVVATNYGISHRKVQSAFRLKRDSPNLYRQVKSGELRLAEAKRESERAAKRCEQQRLAKLARQTQPADKSWRILTGDCLVEMQSLTPGTARLVFADPPYNIGINYGRGSNADCLPDDKYLAWCHALARRLRSPTHRRWQFVGDNQR